MNHKRLVQAAVTHLKNRISDLYALEPRIEDAFAALQAAEAKPRCSGRPHWRGDILYANHSINASCPTHGVPGTGERLRVYIGKKEYKITRTLAAMENHAAEQAAAAAYAALLKKLR